MGKSELNHHFQVRKLLVYQAGYSHEKSGDFPGIQLVGFRENIWRNWRITRFNGPFFKGKKAGVLWSLDNSHQKTVTNSHQIIKIQ